MPDEHHTNPVFVMLLFDAPQCGGGTNLLQGCGLPSLRPDSEGLARFAN